MPPRGLLTLPRCTKQPRRGLAGGSIGAGYGRLAETLPIFYDRERELATEKFDPTTFIDRESEQELFEELLSLHTDAQILAIRDAGGTGKSHLLERFRHRCRTVKPRTPVSLVKLDQLPSRSPLDLVRIVVNDLSTFDSIMDVPHLKNADRWLVDRGIVKLRPPTTMTKKTSFSLPVGTGRGPGSV